MAVVTRRPLAARAWPYQQQADSGQHAAGMAAAGEGAPTLPLAGGPVRYRLRALNTRLEAR
ncbi:hypothetical protein ACIOGZ_28575 [Kitasatospora sp. NPDC088160]|uniref:hypothetical protein n=1 Tax=Kitasatospora sp. NPDC088160 TaxID=3364072 RepID=UPI0038059E8A